MQYVRTQCDNMQKQIGHTSTSVVETIEMQPISKGMTTTNTPTKTQVVDDVVHRSCVLVDAADVALATKADTSATTDAMDTDLSESEDESTEEEDDASIYNDNDQVVDATDLVEESIELTKNSADAGETANELVETLLSTLVQQVESTDTSPTESMVVSELMAGVEMDNAQTTTTTDTKLIAADENSSVENFVQNNGNYATLAETLRKKTVVELKKMCVEYHIGVKKGKSFKRKEELIDELVEKMPQQTA